MDWASTACRLWSLLKRGLHETFHPVDASFLGAYADEVAFRYNTRKATTGERIASALQNVNGRLSWHVKSSQGETQ